MFYLSRQTVRHNWTLYLGSFVALAFGVLMLGLAATATAATGAYAGRSRTGILVTVTGAGEPARKVRVGGEDVSGLQTILGIIGMLSGFITIFVVASTFAFVVASRRRELGLLRLIGATGWQVRLTVLGEALLVAVLAGIAGALGAWALTPALLDVAASTGLSPVRLRPAGAWLPLGSTVVVSVLVALLGARSASRRAARAAPVDALREAAVEQGRIGWLRALTGAVFGAGGIAMVVFIQPGGGEAVVALAMGAPMMLVIGLTALAPLVIPPLARLWGLPLVRTTAGHLARAGVVAAPRRTASLAAPILAISAIAGSMVLTMSATEDSAAANLRRDLTAPVVVAGDGRRDLGSRIAGVPGVAAVDGAIPVTAVRTDRGEADVESALGIDPASYQRTHRVVVRKGSLDALRGNTVAIRRDMASEDGYRLGGTMAVTFLDGVSVRLRVVAILDVSYEMVPGPLLPKALAAAHAGDAAPEEWLVVPSPGVPAPTVIADLNRTLGPDRAMLAEEWLTRSGSELRTNNQWALLIMLGPAGLYSAVAIANTLLMGTLQRRREFAAARLLGVTPGQIRAMVLSESTLVAVLALTMGGVISAFVGVLLRRAMTAGLPPVPVTVPWLTLGAIGGVCLLIATLAALAPTAYILRRIHPADAAG